MPHKVPVTIVLPHREGFGPASAGAVAMVVRRLANASSRYQALVVGPPFDGPGFPGIPFLPAPPPRWLPLTHTQRYAAKLAFVLAQVPPGPVEVHNKPDVALWLARRFHCRPVSLFLHNDPRTMRGARTPKARRRLLARLAQVVTVSSYLRNCLLDGVDAPPGAVPDVLHNSLDAAEVPEPVPPHRRDKTILFAGRFVADKGVDIFIEACARAMPHLPGWRAELIGADGFSFESRVTDYVRRWQPAAAAAGIVMHGYRPHGEVLQAMARAAIVVVPSRWQEPFGLVALEAMACGAALVCSGRGGLAEIGGEACLPFDPDDLASAAFALVRLAGDAGLRTTLSALGVQRAREQFSTAGAIVKLDGLRDRAVRERL